MTALPHVERPPRAFSTNTPQPRVKQGVFYKLLFSVQFRHDFYNGNNGLCPDFSVVPDAASAGLMAQLDMVFRDHKTGFSVYVNETRIHSLVSYIERSEKEDKDAWCWLSFVMLQTNNQFVGITALPIGTVPTGQAMWFCNTHAHVDGGITLLTPGPQVEPTALLQVTGPQIVVDAPGTSIPELVDISGKIVLTPPLPDAPARIDIPKNYAPVRTLALMRSLTPAIPPSTRYWFDLSALPCDVYTVRLNPAPKRRAQAAGFPRRYAYVPANQQAFGIIDLLFVEPNNVKSGVYPVPKGANNATTAAEIGEVNYVLQFSARKTIWQYYVVCRGNGDSLADGLQIEGGTSFEKSNTVLPTGAPAVLFTADTPLQLQQNSTVQLRLTGARQSADGHRNPVRVARLPVAPSTPVWPAPPPGDELGGTSEMYVYV